MDIEIRSQIGQLAGQDGLGVQGVSQPLQLSFGVCVGGRQVEFGQYIPSYRAMLDREGAAGPADVALVGDEAALRRSIDGLRDAGVTDFNAAVMEVDEGARDRTIEFLASLV